MAVNGYSFDEVSLPNPPTYVEGQPIDYVTIKLPTFLKSQYIALLDFISAVQAGFLISSDQVISLDADKITNNTQFTQSLFVGAESKIKLDGVNNQITITDSQGTPVTRVILGKLSGTANDYGLRVVDASGNIKFQTGATTYIDGGIVTANTITATQIAADTITVDQMAANSITATEINVSNLSSVNADLGSCTAGTLTGGTIQTAASGARVNLTTDGINGYNSSGVHVVDIANDGQFRFGPSSGSNITWNNSALTVNGSIITTGNIVEGQVCTHSSATWSATSLTLNATDQTSATVGETAIATITVENVGRDVLVFFNPTFLADNNNSYKPDMHQFNVVLRIRRGSISGTIIGTQYIRHTNISISGATYAAPFDTGASMSVVDGSANGSLASPADTVYVCTAQVEKYLTGSAVAHAKTITTSGTATAVELRA
tara:strand:- start:503 stop:1801 length:1299 start_codon:yes stop_codon:yes gene_type:complete